MTRNHYLVSIYFSKYLAYQSISHEACQGYEKTLAVWNIANRKTQTRPNNMMNLLVEIFGLSCQS